MQHYTHAHFDAPPFCITFDLKSMETEVIDVDAKHKYTSFFLW